MTSAIPAGLRCTHCGNAILASSVNLGRQIGMCGSCGHLIDLQPQLASPQAVPAAPSAPRARMRPPVALPRGLSIREEGSTFGKGGTIVVSRRWLRSKHYVMLLL